jgi:ABC-2 type transport system permease protein
VSAFAGVATALVKGFVRDRTSLFFTLLFPLMFLVLFGGVLDFDSTKRDLVQVGSVPLVEDLSGGGPGRLRPDFRGPPLRRPRRGAGGGARR